MPTSLQGLLLLCILLLRWRQRVIKFSFHQKSEIHLLLLVNKWQVKIPVLTHPNSSPFIPGTISLLQVPSPPSDFPVTGTYQQQMCIMLNNCLECVITLGQWENQVHKAERLHARIGLERWESTKGTAHPGGYTMMLFVLCQIFNVWQGALPGSQPEASGWQEATGTVCVPSLESS